MSKPIKSLVGKQFGRWRVLSFAGYRGHRPAWKCKCACGTEKITTGEVLTTGQSKSCGCLNSELSAKRAKQLFTVHGHFGSKVYIVWGSMIGRCHNPNNSRYSDYGGRGIKVCSRWRHSFSNFLNDMSKPPVGRTLERIDNDGDYKPNNCCWATRSEQALNRRPRRKLPK